MSNVFLDQSTGQMLNILLDGIYGCPGQEAIFTCATNGGALVTAWSSDEYIGRSGRQLQFASTNAVGTRMSNTANPNTFAVLTKIIPGGLITETQLHIIVSEDIPIATVTCSDISGGSSSSIRFKLLRK